MNRRVDLSIGLDHDVGMIHRTEYLRNPADLQPFVVYNGRIEFWEFCGVLRPDGISTYDQLVLNYMKHGAQPLQEVTSPHNVEYMVYNCFANTLFDEIPLNLKVYLSLRISLRIMFERLPTAPTSQELIDRAFRRAKKKAGKKKKRDEPMLQIAGNILSDNLANLVGKYPSFEAIPPFYRDLVDAEVGVDDMRIHLSRVGWASKQIKIVAREHLTKMRKSQDKAALRRAAFGRMASITRTIEPDLVFLNDSRKKLRKMPTVDPDLPTIIVAGYPNVGKSSFLIRVTGARPEIAEYPFTTQGIGVGHFSHRNQRYQVIDTPGLLDRPLSRRNDIELKAVAALHHLPGVVLYILDPSDYCGFPLDEQLALLEDIRSWLDLPILAVANKKDLAGYPGADFSMATQTGEGVAEVLGRLIEILEHTERDDTGA